MKVKKSKIKLIKKTENEIKINQFFLLMGLVICVES